VLLLLAVSSWSQMVRYNLQFSHTDFSVTLANYLILMLGLFPNHIPNPEDKTAMKAITKAVLDNRADLGIIFDTDVDR